MNKKYLPIIIVFLVITILVMGCGTGSELSTPSPLVGHWARFLKGQDEPFKELYFGEVDEEGIGTGFRRELDESAYFTYEILSVGDSLFIKIAEEGELSGWSLEIKFAKDGQSIVFDDREYQYIDSKTEP